MYHVYVFNDLLGSAALYGIGTYMRELKSIYCLNHCCKFSIITLNSDVSTIVKKDDDGIEYIEYPKMPYWNIKLNDKYCRSVAYNLALEIDEKEKNIFHFNYMHHLSLATYLKELYSQSCILLVLHFSKTKSFEINNALGICNSYNKYDECKNQEQAFLVLADRIVTLCTDTQIYIQQSYGINPEKIKVVYNFMNDRKSNVLYAKRKALRNKYGFHVDDKLLLYIGRIDATKGIIDFKKVLKEFNINERIKLLVVGGGEYNKLLSADIECNSRMVFIGEVDNVSTIDELCCISDIGILPSYIEQSSYSAIEMMMHGLPIVGLYSFGLKEMFDLQPVSLLHVEMEHFKYSYTAMAHLIQRLLCNSKDIKTESEKYRFKYEKYYSSLNRNVWRELYSFS